MLAAKLEPGTFGFRAQVANHEATALKTPFTTKSQLQQQDVRTDFDFPCLRDGRAKIITRQISSTRNNEYIFLVLFQKKQAVEMTLLERL